MSMPVSAAILQAGLAMDVTFVFSGEEPFKMEVGFFDAVQDIKQKLQGCKGWPAATLLLIHGGDVLEDVDSVTERYGIVEGSVIHVALADRQPPQTKKKKSKARDDGAPLLVSVVSRCGGGRLEVAVGARGAVSALRRELERAPGFPLPRDGAYFFIHRQSVMDEARSFEWHGVETGDEVVVFEGAVIRAPAY